MPDSLAVGALHQVALVTADAARSAGFYRDILGAEEIARFDPPGLAFYQLGGVRLLIEPGEQTSPAESTLYFRVDDIEAACRTFEARGGVLDQSAHRIHVDAEGQFGPPGNEEWMAFFRDPDGNSLAFAEQRLA
jgi:methylmalonyl-CoA/ethylmalonyl-CoA epimerase